VGILLVTVIRRPEQFATHLPFFAAYILLVALTVARRIDQELRILALAALAYIVGVYVLVRNGPLSTGALYLLVAPWLIAMLAKWRHSVIATTSSILIYTGFALASLMGRFTPLTELSLAQPISAITLSGGFATAVAIVVLTQSALNGRLAHALQRAEGERAEAELSQSRIRDRVDELAATNAQLQRRSYQFETASKISQGIGASLDVDELAQRAADSIRREFDLYHVGIFTLDETAEWAVLKAQAGRKDRHVLEPDFRLKAEFDSIVGRCLTTGQPSIALDVGENAVRFSNPRLPETRSELVLPLRPQDSVLGVLDLHSSAGRAFSQEDLAVFQTIATQLARTMEHAHAFAQLQAKLGALEELEQELQRDQMTRLAIAREAAAYQRSHPEAAPVAVALPPEVENAIARGEIVAQNEGENGSGASLVVPIRLRGEVIGALGIDEDAGEREWTSDEITLVESIADQMAVAIENARLLEQTRQRAERERVIGEVGTQVRASLDPDIILKTTIRELSRVLGAERAFIEITGPSKKPTGPLSAASALEEEVS
jgi:GAF domain-containing protein